MTLMTLGMTSTVLEKNPSLSQLTCQQTAVCRLPRINDCAICHPRSLNCGNIGTVKEVKYTQYMQGVEKLVPKIKALDDNEKGPPG